MYKAILFGSAMLVSVTAMVIMAPNSARVAYAAGTYTIAEDSVFIDEGDGDFAVPGAPASKAETAQIAPPAASVAPVAPAAPVAVEKQPAKAQAGSINDLETTANLPLPEANAPVEVSKNATETAAKLEDAPKAAAPAVADTKEMATEEKIEAPKAEKKAKAAPKAKAKVAAVPAAPAVRVAAKGKFVNTQKVCPMLRAPASDSETMIVVKAPRKIWVEEVDASWVRAFNKNGEPGYVSADCVK